MAAQIVGARIDSVRDPGFFSRHEITLHDGHGIRIDGRGVSAFAGKGVVPFAGRGVVAFMGRGARVSPGMTGRGRLVGFGHLQRNTFGRGMGASGRRRRIMHRKYSHTLKGQGFGDSVLGFLGGLGRFGLGAAKAVLPIVGTVAGSAAGAALGVPPQVGAAVGGALGKLGSSALGAIPVGRSTAGDLGSLAGSLGGRALSDPTVQRMIRGGEVMRMQPKMGMRRGGGAGLGSMVRQ